MLVAFLSQCVRLLLLLLFCFVLFCFVFLFGVFYFFVLVCCCCCFVCFVFASVEYLSFVPATGVKRHKGRAKAPPVGWQLPDSQRLFVPLCHSQTNTVQQTYYPLSTKKLTQRVKWIGFLRNKPQHSMSC